jgi:hypothetical protein
MTQKTRSVSVTRLLVLFGFVLAGVLTASLAMSLADGDWLRSLLHALLLWANVSLIVRNMEDLEQARKNADRR